MYQNLLLLALSFGFLTTSAQSENDATSTKSHRISLTSNGKVPIGKAYFGNSLDGMIFSTAFINDNGIKSSGRLRFTMFLHIGATYNYNFNEKVGVYTGLDLKNIGFIEKEMGIKQKQRVYTLGVPIGLRFGDMEKRSYIFLGAGLDLAVHYKEKTWGINKTKFTEWFSPRTEAFLPYIFFGYAYKGTTIKIQYYPTNFLNEDFSMKDAFGSIVKPQMGKNVNLLLLSFGRDICFGKKK